MKTIVRYDENNESTHLTFVSVNDDYILQPGELDELPQGFITPAKLVDGKLVSSTLAESNTFYGVKPVENKPDDTQQQLAVMSLKIAQLEQNNIALTNMIQAQTQTINNLKGGN